MVLAMDFRCPVPFARSVYDFFTQKLRNAKEWQWLLSQI